MAAGQKSTGSIAAANTFTSSIGLHGYFNVSISGTWDGRVTLQRAFDGTSGAFYDAASFIGNTEEYGFEPEDGVLYRIGIKTGDYNSGTAVLRISQ